EEGDVVVDVGWHEGRQERVAEPLQVRSGRRRLVSQPRQALVERRPAPLDQLVGEEQERGSGNQEDGGLRALSVGCPERRSEGVLQIERLPLLGNEQRWRVSRVCE